MNTTITTTTTTTNAISSLRRRFAAAALVAAGIAGLGAAAPASAATSPGSCDFGAPTINDFVCIDSDDLRLAVGPAHTDNGVLDDALDVDWYDEIGGTTRRASIRGDLFINAGAVGKATMRVSCLHTNGSTINTRTVELVSNSSFHTGLARSANLSCSSTNLDKVRVRITFEDFGGARSDSKAASYRGN